MGSLMARSLEIFADYTCPWCYFSTRGIDELQSQTNVAIKWVAFSLRPDIPDSGEYLEDIFAGLGLDIDRMMENLKRTADRLDLPFMSRSMAFNSSRAQELGKWAEEKGYGNPFHKSVFHACFARGSNIAQLGILKDLADGIGLNPDEAELVLRQGRYRKAVELDWKRSRQLRITTGPTFSFNGRTLVGAQSCHSLKQLINS